MMKRWLRSSKAKTAEKKETETQPFYSNPKYLGLAVTVLFLIFAVGVSFYLRSATVDLRITDQIARDNIQQSVTSQLAQQVRAQYPTLPDSAVAQEAQKRWLEFEKTNAQEIETQAKAYSQQIKSSYQFTSGTTKPYNQTYVLEMDPYLYWTWALHYADHGTPCVEGAPRTENGRGCMDMQRLAPMGTPIYMNLHTWLEAQAIKIGRALNGNLDTLTIIFFFPIILGSLAVIPAFFIGKKLAGNIGGFISGIIIATHPVLMGRTIGGFADTDGYNYLFPLLIIWFIFEALEAKHWWSRLTLGAGAGILVGLYAFAWSGYFFTLFVLVACFLAFLGYRVAVSLKRSHFSVRGILKGLKELKEPASVFAAFLVFSGISITLILDFNTFIRSFTSPFTFSSSLQSATSSGALAGWPNILTTVAELNVPSLSGIVGNLGGTLIVVLAGFGLFVSIINPRKLSWMESGLAVLVMLYYYLLVKKGLALSPITFLFLFALPLIVAIAFIFIRDLETDLRYPIFMMGWLLATLFATTKGIRFLLLGITPFAVGAGIALGWLFIASTTALIKEIKRPIIVNVVVGAILLLIVFNPAAAYNPIKIGHSASAGQFPGMNDAWWEAMTRIREDTPENTIITSWWDFGHWFRNIGNRSVTFDGASQDPEPGHLVGRILLTPDEKEAVGLLRMIDCGQNTAFNVARKTLDVVPARNLITELILTDRAGAKKILAATTIPSADQATMLEATHCTPPPAVFITSGDMIGKGAVWGHFGSWDFKRAMAYSYAKSLPQSEALPKLEELGYTPAEAISTYTTIRAFETEGEANAWIAPWPSYYTQGWTGCSVSSTNSSNRNVTCPIMLNVQQNNQGVVVIEDVVFNEKNPLNATARFALYVNGVKASPSQAAAFAKIVVADVRSEKLTRTTAEVDAFNMGALIRVSGNSTNPSYNVIISDPLQTESLYTHLYFLDGAFTPHFSKFVELRGDSIIVWNVTWPKD